MRILPGNKTSVQWATNIVKNLLMRAWPRQLLQTAPSEGFNVFVFMRVKGCLPGNLSFCQIKGGDLNIRQTLTFFKRLGAVVEEEDYKCS